MRWLAVAAGEHDPRLTAVQRIHVREAITAYATEREEVIVLIFDASTNRRLGLSLNAQNYVTAVEDEFFGVESLAHHAGVAVGDRCVQCAGVSTENCALAPVLADARRRYANGTIVLVMVRKRRAAPAAATPPPPAPASPAREPGRSAAPLPSAAEISLMQALRATQLQQQFDELPPLPPSRVPERPPPRVPAPPPPPDDAAADAADATATERTDEAVGPLAFAGAVTSLLWLEAGRLLATGADGRVDVWEADGRREPRPLKALAPSGGRGVQCACALGDGTAGVCVGGSAGLLRVYDTASGRLRLELAGGDACVWGVDATRKLLASASDDRAVRLWDLRSQRAVARLTCLLYTSPSPRDGLLSRMPSSA